MTNKLRSVIEENVQYLSGYGASERAVLECELNLLDAIIDEIDEQYKQHPTVIPNATFLFRFINNLKQAREELSNM